MQNFLKSCPGWFNLPLVINSYACFKLELDKIEQQFQIIQIFIRHEIGHSQLDITSSHCHGVINCIILHFNDLFSNPDCQH